MRLINKEKASKAIKIVAEEGGQEVGRAWLYIIYNDLHKMPYGLLEDVFVEEQFRSSGIGTKLVNEVVIEAKKQGCYKLIGCSRHSRPKVHALYESLGFINYGVEFRMDL